MPKGTTSYRGQQLRTKESPQGNIRNEADSVKRSSSRKDLSYQHRTSSLDRHLPDFIKWSGLFGATSILLRLRKWQRRCHSKPKHPHLPPTPNLTQLAAGRL